MIGEAELRELEEDGDLWKPKADDVGGLMAKTMEELGEAQAALGKCMRWGFDSVDPTIPVEDRVTNLDWFMNEMKDVIEALVRLDDHRDASP